MSCLMVSNAAQNQQHFLYNGAEVKTDGNPLAHAILRGANNENGQNIVNYHYEDLVKALDKYSAFNLENPFILVDTNHDNSGKNFMEQVRMCVKSFLTVSGMSVSRMPCVAL